MRNSVIYFSETGNTEAIARFVADDARSVEGMEARLFRPAEGPDKSFVNESAAVRFGAPTHCASLCWQMKKWFDTEWDVRLGGRLGAAFATENSPNGGGAEAAILSVIPHLLVRGMPAHSSVAERGRPFIHIGPAAVRDQIAEKEELCGLFGRRVALKADKLFGASSRRGAR